MNFLSTDFEGVYLIENKILKDNRGEFQKLFQKSLFMEKGLEISIDEHFFSVSQRGVIRGMHFQLPPHVQSKLVYVIHGKIADVIVDLRKNSRTFKQSMLVELSSKNRKAIFIPEGFAHGFQSFEDNTVMVYSQSEEFYPESDCGISPFSFEMTWPLKNYIVSEKDKNLTPLNNFKSPF